MDKKKKTTIINNITAFADAVTFNVVMDEIGLLPENEMEVMGGGVFQINMNRKVIPNLTAQFDLGGSEEGLTHKIFPSVGNSNLTLIIYDVALNPSANSLNLASLILYSYE